MSKLAVTLPMLTFTLPSQLEVAAPDVQSSDTPAQASGVYGRRLIWGLLALGTLLRLAQYFYNRSLWYDEAMLALNVLHRSWSGLLQPLDYNQGAPIGFLFLEKLSSQMLGKSELALRAIPLLAGVAALFLFRHLAEKYLSPKAVPIAVGLFALAGPLIYYSSEAKQYSTDVLVSLALLWAFSESNIPTSGTRLIRLGVTGAIAIWFSHPASFVLAGAGITWICFILAKRDWRSLRVPLCVLAAWSFSFAACYLVSLRTLSHSQTLLNHWQNQFLPWPPWSIAGSNWLVENWFTLFRTSAGLTDLLAAALFTAGTGALLVRSRWTAVLLVSPAAVAVLASALHKYPLEGRFMLFFAPNLLLLVSEGTLWMADKTRRLSPVIGTGLVALLFAQPIFTAGQALMWPRYPDDIKPVILHMWRNERSGDGIYVYHAANFQFWYYAELYHMSLDNVRIGTNCAENPVCYVSDIKRTPNQGRVWALFSHLMIPNGLYEEKLLMQYLESVGSRMDFFRNTGCRVYLYELHASSAPSSHDANQKE